MPLAYPSYRVVNGKTVHCCTVCIFQVLGMFLVQWQQHVCIAGSSIKVIPWLLALLFCSQRLVTTVTIEDYWPRLRRHMRSWNWLHVPNTSSQQVLNPLSHWNHNARHIDKDRLALTIRAPVFSEKKNIGDTSLTYQWWWRPSLLFSSPVELLS